MLALKCFEFERCIDYGRKGSSIVIERGNVDTAKCLVTKREYSEIGETFIVRYGSDVVFVGYLSDVRGKSAGVKELKFLSYARKLLDVYVFRVWQNVWLEDVVRDIVEKELGLTIEQIDESNILLERWICRETAIENLSKLAYIAEAEFFIDENGKFYWLRKGARDSGYVFKDGEDSKIVSIRHDDRKLCNTVIVKGGEVLTRTHESFSGDGSTMEFELKYRPVSVKVLIDGTEQSRDSYEVIEEQKKIRFDSPPADGSTIDVYYDYFYPITVRLKDYDSIARYGVRSKVVEAKWIKTMSDAIEYARGYLAKYAKPILTVTVWRKFDVNEWKSLFLGYKVRLVSELHNIDEDMVIVGMRLMLDRGIIEYKLSNLEYDTAFLLIEAMRRIKEIERRLSSEDKITDTLLKSEILMRSVSDTQVESLVSYDASFTLGISDITTDKLSWWR